MQTKFKPEHLTRWTLPRDYMGAHWDEYFSFMGQSRDSGCLERSNFADMLGCVRGKYFAGYASELVSR